MEMEMELLPLEIKLALLAALLLVTSFLTYRYEENKWTAALADQKLEAAVLLAQEVDKVRQKERNASALTHQTEVQNVKSLEDRNSQLTSALSDKQRLRDPGSRQSSSCPKSPVAGNPNSNNPTTGGAELSGEATEFLRRLANQCDRVADQYLTCQSYAVGLHKICQE